MASGDPPAGYRLIVLVGFMGSGKSTVGSLVAARLGWSFLDFDDEIAFEDASGRFVRRTNNAGGTEGGMSSGEPLVVRTAFKPLSTLMSPLHSVDIATKAEAEAAIERSDVVAIPAAAVIAEAVVAFVLADAFLEKFGGDSLLEIRRNYQGYLEQVRRY